MSYHGNMDLQCIMVYNAALSLDWPTIIDWQLQDQPIRRHGHKFDSHNQHIL